MMAIIGNCTDSPNPDAWFPDIPNGRPSQAAMIELARVTREAIAECNSCPSKQACLEEGMRDVNITEGIWGGLLSGERLKLKGHRREDFTPKSDEGRAWSFTERMTPLVRW